MRSFNDFFKLFIVALFAFAGTIFTAEAQLTTPVPPPEASAGTWQCLRGSQRLQGIQYMKGSFSNQPVVKWKTPLSSLKGGCEGEPVIGDVNGDGKNDVLVAVQNGDLFAFDGTTGAVLWTKPGVAGSTSPVIGDANGDNKMDIAIVSDQLYLLDGATGNIIWNFPVTVASHGNIETCPNMADLDGDGKVEVVFIVDDKAYAVNGLNGTQKWVYATTRPDSTIYNGSAPAIGDVNGDGILDVVAPLENGVLGRLSALNGSNGALIWGHAVYGLYGPGFPVPSIGDVDGDCKVDVVYNGAALRGLNGSVIWGDPTSTFNSTWGLIADMNDDCNIDVVTDNALLKGKDGSTIWTNTAASQFGWYAPAPRVGDFNPASPGKEIVIADAYQVQSNGSPVANPSPIRMLSGNTGSVLWSYDIATLLGHSVEGISVADVDNDGCVEIIVVPDCCYGDPSVLVLDDSSNTANCGILASVSQVDFHHDSISCSCFNYQDFSSACANSWNWTFQGGTPDTSTAKNPGMVCYTSPGTYSITMTAKLNACVTPDTVVHSVIIGGALPDVHFHSSDSIFCNESGTCIDFTDVSSGNPTSWQWTFQAATPDTSTQQNPNGICYYAPGTYSVKLIAGNACGYDTLLVSAMIVFAPLPSAPTLSLSGDTIHCSHASAYQWYFNGTPITGATDSFYVALLAGNYAVMITDSLGCSRLSNGILASTDELHDLAQIKITPNPSNGTFYLSFNRMPDNISLKIYNTLGEEIHSEEMTSRNAGIKPITLHVAGIYFLQLSSKEKQYREKIIVQ